MFVWNQHLPLWKVQCVELAIVKRTQWYISFENPFLITLISGVQLQIEVYTLGRTQLYPFSWVHSDLILMSTINLNYLSLLQSYFHHILFLCPSHISSLANSQVTLKMTFPPFLINSMGVGIHSKQWELLASNLPITSLGPITFQKKCIVWHILYKWILSLVC